MEPIPALESIPLWNRFHAIPIPVLLLTIPTPVPIPEKNGIITPLVHIQGSVYKSDLISLMESYK